MIVAVRKIVLTVYMATKITVTDVANAIHFVKASEEVVVVE